MEGGTPVQVLEEHAVRYHCYAALRTLRQPVHELLLPGAMHTIKKKEEKKREGSMHTTHVHKHIGTHTHTHTHTHAHIWRYRYTPSDTHHTCTQTHVDTHTHTHIFNPHNTTSHVCHATYDLQKTVLCNVSPTQDYVMQCINYIVLCHAIYNLHKTVSFNI